MTVFRCHYDGRTTRREIAFEVGAALQGPDRLTLDEARATATQTLEVVCGLVQNMKTVMDNGKASIDGVRNVLEGDATNHERSEQDKTCCETSDVGSLLQIRGKITILRAMLTMTEPRHGSSRATLLPNGKKDS
ncbi:hypothetical protein BJV78DRAFT_1284036 [Lactifluus subvellereus]|nr:hypothetical protein BJV78DRAFT_1284036 [Lactifluus subvellereus]